MKERNMTVSIAQAREWFNSGNKQLQELALQVFDRKELTSDFRHIVTFEDACKVLGLRYSVSYEDRLNRTLSISTSAMFRLNIIRQALNFGQDMHLTKDPRNSYNYYPYNPFITNNSTYYKNEIISGRMEVIGKIKSKGEEYNVLGGDAISGGNAGLGNFYSSDGVGGACANSGFLGCASREIAEHFGKYFGMLITTAKYADIIKDFEVIESKYII